MRNYSPVEIDFEDGECKETFESRLIYAVNRVKALNNPYVGNKRKILFNILNILEQEKIKYNSILDLFSGSGCVALTMKLMGKQVYANDILKSSFALLYSFLNKNNTIDKEKQSYLIYNKNDNAGEFVQYYFSLRFTHKECVFLDNYYANILDLREDMTENDLMEDSLALIAFANLQLFIVDHCFVGGRLNNGQILAQLEHRLQHARNKGRSMDFRKMKWHSFENKSEQKHFVFSVDALDMLKCDEVNGLDTPDLLYIDPPYGGEQSDYAKMYEFFESYITQEIPENLNHLNAANKFTKSKNYRNNFTELIQASTHFSTIVVSYNNSSWTDIDEVIDIMKKYKTNVSVRSIEYNYQYRDKDNKKGVEYLIIAREESITLP